MEVSKIKKALIEQKNINLSGNLYYRTKIYCIITLPARIFNKLSAQGAKYVYLYFFR